MFNRLRAAISRIFRYSGAEEYTRRYATMNAFDGVITILGIIFGSVLLGGAAVKQILAAGIGASIAMAISGASGTYMTEKAEQERKIKEIEEAMLMRLDGTLIFKARKKAAIISAIADSLSAMLAGLVTLLPYFAAAARLLTPEAAFYSSTAIALGLLFTLGIFLGKIANKDVIMSGFRSLMIGLVTLLLITLLNLVL
ncbi:MAG: VIT1/CCC1 transporter family protein [Aigarchaeota archaeon]|nr:VIT1/CCC1 transporter family protein [Aigarchaeota archaeon]MDW8022057.1 VIT1/CCC1 transporter family protein [Nitrososphaerota archaeon]